MRIGRLSITFRVKVHPKPYRGGRPKGSTSARDAAEQWLRDYLMRAGEPCKVRDIKFRAAERGISDRTLLRAANELGVVRLGHTRAAWWAFGMTDEATRWWAEAAGVAPMRPAGAACKEAK